MAEVTVNKRTIASKRPGPWNWLRELDREVRLFPRAANWLEHPVFQFYRCRLFMMARYPRLLRPFSNKVLCREWSRGETQIRESSARCVLDDLNAGQCKQLFALFQDVIFSFQFYTAYRRRSTRVHKLAGEETRRIRMLTNKLAKARVSLGQLSKYAKSLDPVLGREYIGAADACLERLGKVKDDRYPAFFQSIKAEYPPLEDPATLGMIELYWLFRHGCALSGHESEVRVGLIRNTFWTSYGVPEIPVRSKGQPEESKGCDAVRIAVLRFKREHSAKKNQD